MRTGENDSRDGIDENRPGFALKWGTTEKENRRRSVR
jgi:hypothetical protein